MLFTPLLVRLRLRYGVRFVVFCLASVVLSFPFVIQLKGVDFGVFNNPLNVLFGVGPSRFGPSVWHSMSFVLSGMLLASSLTADTETLRNAFSRFYLIVLGLVSICAVAWFPLVHDGPAEAWVKFVDFSYRESNMPGYYLIGIVTSVFWITLFSLLIGTRELSRPVRFFLPLGLSSLFSYTTGNVLLNLSGYVATRVDPTLYIAVFFVSVLIITKYIDRMPYYEYANELMCLRFPRRAHAEASLPAGAAPALGVSRPRRLKPAAETQCVHRRRQRPCGPSWKKVVWLVSMECARHFHRLQRLVNIPRHVKELGTAG